MRTLISIMVLLHIAGSVHAQKKSRATDLANQEYVISQAEIDTTPLRDKASQTLRSLRNGAVIVRLKTNLKSIDAYRKAGQPDIADRIEADRKKQNQKMYRAFQNNFLFCKVYFIYANETEEFNKGNHKVFLNEDLQHDTTIVFTDTNFVFCEYGSVEAFSKFDDYKAPAVGTGGLGTYVDAKTNRIQDSVSFRTSTSPATTSGLVFLDKELHQLHRPFPFVEGVYMDNYDAPIRTLNREMERAYGRLVIRRDFNEQMKKERKRQKELLKQYK